MISIMDVLTRNVYSGTPKPRFKNSLAQIGTKRFDAAKANRMRSMNLKRSIMGRPLKRMPVAR